MRRAEGEVSGCRREVIQAIPWTHPKKAIILHRKMSMQYCSADGVPGSFKNIARC